MSRRYLTRIHFADHGQDFLWWDIDAACRVVGCGPFQAWLWAGAVVIAETVEVGRCIRFISPRGSEEVQLRYAVTRVETGRLAARRAS